jgi:PAS domain S-box-containing protein
MPVTALSDSASVSKLPLIRRYGVALLAVLGATAARLALEPVLGKHSPYLPFVLAIMLAARFGGGGPGLAATAASVIACCYFFVEPRFLAFADATAAWGLGLFFVVGAGISLLSGQLHQALVSLARGERRLLLYELLVAHSRDIILFVRRDDGRILEVNDAAARAYGYNREEMLVLSIYDLRVNDTRKLIDDQMAQADGQSILFETVHRRKDGSTFPVEVSSQGAAIRGARTLMSVVRDITERKRAEDAVRQSSELTRKSELQYRELFEHMSEGLAYCRMIFEDGQGRDFIYLAVNAAFATLTGLKDVTGKRVTEVIPGIRDSDPGLLETYARVATTGMPEKFEVCVDALGMWFSISAYSPEKGFFVAVFDVTTERKRTENALRESERRYRLLFEHNLAAVFRTVGDGHIVDANESFVRMLGYESSQELRQKQIWELWDKPEDQTAFVARLAKERALTSVELCLRRRDGSRVWALANVTLNGGGTAEAPVIEGTMIDITDRKRAEEDRALLAAIVESTDDAIVGRALDGTIVSWNRGAEKIYGYSATEVEGKSVSMLLPPGKLDERLELMERVTRGESVDHYETVGVRKDGQQINESVTLSPIRDGAGKIVAVSAIARDITERKRQEAENLRLATAIEQAGEGVVVTDAEGTIEYVNPAFTRITGYGRAEALGQNPRILKSGRHDSKFYEEMWATILAGRTWHGEIVNQRKDGNLYTEEMTITPVRGAPGTTANFIAIKQDITERKQAEEARRAREAAESASRAKTEFLSGMSHELRTPLNVILGFAQVLRKHPNAEDNCESLDQILKSGRHLLGLINEVLDVGRLETGSLSLSSESVCINRVVREVMDLIRPLAIQASVQLCSSLPEQSDWQVLADPQRLTQVLLNLLSNAVKYNRNGGSIGIHGEVFAPGHLRLRIADTGWGISPDALQKLFTPFERLGAERTEIEGTGLGLALSKRLVEAMGGGIGAESTPGLGSTFWVDLPLVEGRTDVMDPSSRARRTVLCIEDNPSNLKLIQRALAHRPEVSFLSAMQGGVGLALAREHRPDVILLDLGLPDIPGQEVLNRLRADPRTSGIPTIIISADAAQCQIDKLMTVGAQAYLTKPFDLDRFLQALDCSLNGHRIKESAVAAGIASD